MIVDAPDLRKQEDQPEVVKGLSKPRHTSTTISAFASSAGSLLRTRLEELKAGRLLKSAMARASSAWNCSS